MNQPQLGSFEYIALDAIRPSPTNPRKNFDQVALEELAASIREVGVTVPVTLRPMYNQDEGDIEFFQIVTGERRFRAAVIAGLTHLPAIVGEMSNEDAADLQLVENLQRADLHPVEEAEGYRALMAGGATVEDVAKKAGKTAAHVAKMLKLLLLELPVKELFHAGHLTLGHALLLARLTPADQDRAVRELLNVNHLPAKEDMGAKVNYYMAEHVKYGHKHRLVRQTEAQLREWIHLKVLLSLSNAPWSLSDPDLVPEAGACTTCPKRSGTDAALFADITVDQDACLDASCFATKQKALITQITKASAKGERLVLKLSAKAGHQPVGEPGKKLMYGQWLPAQAGSCRTTAEGVLVDDPGSYSQVKAKPGEIIHVCANQKCTVHKHTVDAPSPSGTAASIQARAAKVKETEAERSKKMLAERGVKVERERRIRGAIATAIEEHAKHFPGDVTRYTVVMLLGEGLDQNAPRWAIVRLGMKVKIREGWLGAADAEEGLTKHIKSAGIHELPNIALALMMEDALTINEWNEPNESDSRERLWELAKFMKVDAEEIAERVEDELDAAAELDHKAVAASPNAELPAVKKTRKKISAADQATRKKAAAKKFPAKAAKNVSGLDGKSKAAGAGKAGE